LISGWRFFYGSSKQLTGSMKTESGMADDPKAQAKDEPQQPDEPLPVGEGEGVAEEPAHAQMPKAANYAEWLESLKNWVRKETMLLHHGHSEEERKEMNP
jgi:hypothetical protein